MLKNSMVVLLLLSTITTFSQETSGPKRKFAFVADSLSFYGKAVLNIAGMKGKLDDQPFETTLGYSGGFYGEYKISHKTGVTAGVEYRYRGVGIEDDNASGSLSYRVTYLELPIISNRLKSKSSESLIQKYFQRTSISVYGTVIWLIKRLN